MQSNREGEVITKIEVGVGVEVLCKEEMKNRDQDQKIGTHQKRDIIEVVVPHLIEMIILEEKINIK